ncbi:MAG TPA: hypothetical protein VKT72_14195, partial [Candidatus Baltobacteraceae bacterium]|nr:hypothetical protein [Candidatus Baltobacteraceae bacterium]
FGINGKELRQEIAGQSVRGLAAGGSGSVLAIVGDHSVYRRSANGQWAAIAAGESTLSCCVAIEDAVCAGTEDARVLRLDRDGALHWLTGFDMVEGRERWYAGSAMVDGKFMGPPLGVRSMAATCDGCVLLANVHVGGIPRSTDGGFTWQPTIDIDCDVHQVCAHPTRPDIVIAAAAVGLCVSRDAGATWTIEQRGLHALHCSAVAFGTKDLFISASAGPFAAQGAVYRRPIDGNDPLQRLSGGIPEWTEGKADTDCIASRDSTIAIIDRSGSLYVSHDDGTSWSRHAARVPAASALLIL